MADAWKKPKTDALFHQSPGQHETGVTIGAYKGLDFKLTMEILSMVRHGKRNSLPYQELMEEGETEMGVIALVRSHQHSALPLDRLLVTSMGLVLNVRRMIGSE